MWYAHARVCWSHDDRDEVIISREPGLDRQTGKILQTQKEVGAHNGACQCAAAKERYGTGRSQTYL